MTSFPSRGARLHLREADGSATWRSTSQTATRSCALSPRSSPTGRPLDLLVNNAGVQYSHCVSDFFDEDRRAAIRT
jgi:NAD(P)-dependent dehydrogenase (short-subunit alcohol dehydrogenase family)